MIDGYNIIEQGSPVPATNRFSDPIALRAVYDKLTDDDMMEAARRVKLRQMYEGNLPYNPEQLRNSGLKNLTNVNFLGLKGAIDNRADAVLALAADTTNLIELQPLSRELAGPDAAKIADIVAEEFSRTVRETGKIIPALAMMNTEADLFGLGPVTWTSSLDYNPVALERGQIRFIGNGSVISSNHDLFMFEAPLQASYLFYLLDNAEIASREGWNLNAVQRWLVDVFGNSVSTEAQPGVDNSTSYVEQQLAYFRQNRYQEEHQFDEMKVIHAFVREMAFPRAITHIIMPSTELKEFLFVKQNAYRTMDECFLWFPYSVNVRYARAVRGLASFLYPIEALNNRFLCQFVDAAMRASSFILANKGPGGQPNLTINEYGPYTLLPQEFTPAPAAAPNFQQLVQVKQMLDQIGVGSVTGVDKRPITTSGPKLFEGSDRQTKAEVELQQSLRAHKEEALFIQRLSVLDKVFRETFKRFIRLAISGNEVLLADYPEIIEFLQRCARRQITPDILARIPQEFAIATCRDLVLGGRGKVGVLTEVLGQFGGTLDEPGRKSAVRDIVHLRLGRMSADKYIPETSRDQAPSDAASLATLENDMIQQGQPVLVGQDQLHWSHIPIHVQIIQQIMQQVGASPDNQPTKEAVQNIQNPKQTLQVLVTCSEHIQQHVQIGGQQIGMQAQAQQVMSMLHSQDLRATIKALNLAVATQERVEEAEREKQQRQMEELQKQADENEFKKAAYAADKKAEIDRYRADLDHQVAMHKLGLDSETRRGATQIAAEKAASDSNRADAEAEARMDREAQLVDARVKASSQLNRMKMMNRAVGNESVTPSDIISGGVDPDVDAVF